MTEQEIGIGNPGNIESGTNHEIMMVGEEEKGETGEKMAKIMKTDGEIGIGIGTGIGTAGDMSEKMWTSLDVGGTEMTSVKTRDQGNGVEAIRHDGTRIEAIKETTM